MNEFGVGLIVAAALYGFRHGFDFDHLAAIGDISGSSGDRRRALRSSTFYVLGHALVVLCLGLVAVTAGASIPASLDAVMTRVIGVTLIGLAVYLTYTAVRYRGNVRFRSRWMLAADGVRALSTKVRARRAEVVVVEHSHPHSHDGAHDHDHHHAHNSSTGRPVTTVATHAHVHTHVATMPADPFTPYGSKAAFGIGMIHGVGAETPSQVLLFASVAGAGSPVHATSVLIAFLIGLVMANGIVAIAATMGFGGRARMPRLYVAVAILTATFSFTLGLSYVLGRGDVASF
ncbi:MAG: hypothetical protein KY391_02110 [Actinobacteria bacterium]|nr:hypothetical protein [Actinomycetota bacterium]